MEKNMNPTDRQQEVLDFLIGYIRENGYSPSCEVIGKHFGWSSANAAAVHLQLLAKKNLVRKTTRGYLPA